MKVLQSAFILMLLEAVVLLSVQEPGPVAARDDHYTCTSPTAPDFSMNYKRQDRAIQTEVNMPNLTTDVTVPTISNVVVSGGASVLANTGKIQAGSNGVPFSITAWDDVGVTSANLYVDGKLGAVVIQESGFRSLFYIRWNAGDLALGNHSFRLVIFDLAGNLAERAWTMERI